MGQKLAKTELFAEWLGGNLTIADQGLSTGRRVFVDSATGTDAGGYGANPEAPVATLDYAVGLCTDNQGDIIYLMPGHDEERTTTGELADLDIAGITVQGIGVGADRPTFTLSHAGAKITVDGASITIRNIRVVSGVADCAQALDVGGDADGLTVEDCEFKDGGTAILELKVAIAVATGCDDVTIRNCRFLTVEGGTITSAITLEGTHDNCHIVGNYINGDHGSAGILGTAGAGTRMLIAENWIKTKDGEPGIELKADTTGVISDNRIATSGMADPDLAIVAADCEWFRNFCVVTDGKADELIGAVESGSVEGKVDSVGTLTSTATSTVTAAHTATDSKVISAHVVTDSKIVSAHVVSDSTVVSAHVVTDAAVATADSKVVSAHVVTDSTIVSAHVVTDAAVAVLESWDVRTVKKSALALDAGGVADVFTVANGPIELLGLIAHTTEAVSAHACDTKWQSDPTVGASSTDLCGNVDINAMAIGSSLYIDGPSASAGVIAVNGTAGPEMCDTHQVVMPGGIDLVQANSNPTAGIADVYLVYRPLSSTATVTA